MSKVAVITGSAKGIGAIIALSLAEAGCSVVLNYRKSQDKAEQILQSLHSKGAEAISVQADVSQHDQAKKLVDETMNRFHKIDYLINAAGPFIWTRKYLMDYDIDQWRRVLDGNLSSVFYLAKYVLPIMRQNGFGRMINFGFDDVDTAPEWPYRAPYASAKTGLVSLTKSIAAEERIYGITANMISTGDIRNKEKNEAIHDMIEKGEIRRTNACLEIVKFVEFMLSSTALNGSIVNLSGGRNIRHEVDILNTPMEPDTLSINAKVKVLPWQAEGVILSKEEDYYRRWIYTVKELASDRTGEFGIDQLEVTP